jgi:NAD(P)H dehydrogenase (quinone)
MRGPTSDPNLSDKEPAMKHAVIVAHPSARSRTSSAAKAYASAVKAAGDDVVVRDLYRLGFDPCLKADEIPRPSGYQAASDVVAERDALSDVGVFALVYPFWFNAPPAILKGYVDRVFSMGFGYGPMTGGTEPLLEGRKLISLILRCARQLGARDRRPRVPDDSLRPASGRYVRLAGPRPRPHRRNRLRHDAVVGGSGFGQRQRRRERQLWPGPDSVSLRSGQDRLTILRFVNPEELWP